MATIEEAATKNNWREEAGTVSWFALEPAEITSRLGVDPASGLSGSEAASRLASVGPNKFAETAVEPRWRAFVRQYRDPMQIVLLVAGIGSLYPLKELGTGLVLLFLTLFNAVLGLRQEGKAAEAVAALQKMMIVKARVRRDGQLVQIPAEQLVPGDIVSIDGTGTFIIDSVPRAALSFARWRNGTIERAIVPDAPVLFARLDTALAASLKLPARQANSHSASVGRR